MKQIIEWSQGNPGALDFLMRVFMSPEANLGQAILISSKLESYTTLRGTNIYVLYSDLCGRDVSKVVTLLQKCPQKILEDACSRQDYSGIKLIEKYL